MKITPQLMALGLAMSVCCNAYATSQKALSESYFQGDDTPLTPQEKAALESNKRFTSANDNSMRPIAQPDGSIQFPFGAMQPSIVCAPLKVCDIELQPGETINGLQSGDPRFLLDPAITGAGAGQTVHVLVKPTDVDLDTTLVITTDRRTYHLRLRSHRTAYMPRVFFSYPEEMAQKLASLQRRAEVEQKKQVLPETGEYLSKLDFNYDVSGDAPWKPIRVYNDGNKTIIQMPGEVAQGDAPVLLVLRGGGLFTDPEQVLVNYRLQRDRFIVDSLFDKAMLVVGIGDGQESVTISRRK